MSYSLPSRLVWSAGQVAHAIGLSEETFRRQRLEREHRFPAKLPGLNAWSIAAVTGWVNEASGAGGPVGPDSVADWARESLLPAAGSRVETFDAYWHYRRWCHHRGDRRLQANHRAFFDRLDALGYIRRREDHHSVVLDVQLAAAFGEVS